MSLAKELRKLADRIEGTGLFKARKMGIALKHLALFERVRALSEINTVFDVGANCGHFSSAAAKCFPATAVYTFEPLTVCQADLHEVQRRLATPWEPLKCLRMTTHPPAACCQ